MGAQQKPKSEKNRGVRNTLRRSGKAFKKHPKKNGSRKGYVLGVPAAVMAVKVDAEPGTALFNTRVNELRKHRALIRAENKHYRQAAERDRPGLTYPPRVVHKMVPLGSYYN